MYILYNFLGNKFKGAFSVKLLEERIARDGQVIGSDILKVDMFLNHQIDPLLIDELGKEFYRYFKESGATKILTVESSGIAIAVMTAKYFEIPVIFAKKATHRNVGSETYTAKCYSYTHGTEYTLNLSKKYLLDIDKILIIDDFLADGNACNAMIELINSAGAELVGIGIAVEKGFQSGGAALRAKGIDLRSLAIVDSMSENGISFRADNV